MTAAPRVPAKPAVTAKAPSSGFELALHGSTTVLEGRTAHYRGVAYRVLGLAKLQPLPLARVRARYGSDVGTQGTWSEVRADRRGFFTIAVPMPGAHEGTPRLEISVGDGQRARLLKFPLAFDKPWLLDLRSDRRLYQPGEPVHVWARLRDRRSRQPIAGQRIRLSIAGVATASRSLVTGASGVASMRMEIPAQAAEGGCSVIARIGTREVRGSFRVGTRTYERLFAQVAVSPKTARPHQKITVTVKVTTASGAVVRDAIVDVKVDEGKASALTDGKGVATLALHAPAYMSHATGTISVRARIRHPAHGSALTYGTLGLAVPHTLEVEALPPNGGLVPELASALYIRLKDGAGQPPPVGTEVEVRGAAIVGGRQAGVTDKHGMVRVRARLPRGAASAGEYGKATTTIVVHVEGASEGAGEGMGKKKSLGKKGLGKKKSLGIVPRTAAVSVPVLRHAEVIPSVEKPVVAAGEPLQIALARRVSARRLPVVVELLAGKTLIAAQLAPAGMKRVTFAAPQGRLGVLRVRARPLRQRGTVEGAGGVDALIVRPNRPSFPTLSADKKLYRVKSTARLTLRTAPGAARSWAAVLVRDLAAHAGEGPFSLTFLSQAFDRAILDPQTKAAETLLRAALAAYVYEDAKPRSAPRLLDELGLPLTAAYGLSRSSARGVLRDPFPLSDELSRRGIGRVMRAVERALAKALDSGRLARVSTRLAKVDGRRGRRGFVTNLLAQLDEQDVPKTLGDGALTLAMIQATDPSFSYDNVARRVARVRLVRLMVALAKYLDPGDEASVQQRTAAREPYVRWLPRMVERGLIKATQLADPWGGSFVLRRTKKPTLLLAVQAASLELVSAGPDGKLGTADDLRDPFARAVPAKTPYAVASGEDALMRLLASLAPGKEALKRLLAAYARVTAEVAEEKTGDAVSADVSEGLIGNRAGESYGVGGLGLSGTGRGGGGSGSGTIGMGRMGTIGKGGGGGYGLSGFARVIRERFPPTLYFAPAMRVDASGQTEFPLKLSDAVTTYVVEAIVWSADGWTWSAQTRIRVDKETVIDAPVPRNATVGDVLELPVRLANRMARGRTLAIAVYAPGKPDAPVVQRAGVHVPAHGAVAVPIELKLQRAVDGKVSVGVLSEKGVALDAVSRKMTVRRPMRRVRRSVERLASGKATLRLNVPASAMPRGGAEITIRAGAGMFALPWGSVDGRWVAAWSGRAQSKLTSRSTMSALYRRPGVRLAWGVGTAWAAPSVRDYLVSRALKRLTRGLSRRSRRSLSLRQRAKMLLMLAPAIRRVGARAKLAGDLAAVVRSLRATVNARVASVSDDPLPLTLAAAALAATAPMAKGSDAAAKDRLERVRELVRRARRHQISVGAYTWIATRKDGHVASALLALAELSLGERGRALRLLSTLGRFELAAQSTMGQGTMGSLGSWPKALARVACSLLSGGRPAATARLEIDGRVTTVELHGGVARVPAPALARPGRHTIVIDVAPASRSSLPKLVLSHVRATTEYGVPWSVRPERPGSIVVTIEGKSRGRDQRATLELLVTNRSPRTIAAPTLEVSLPAGAELDERGRIAMRRTLAAGPDETRGTLRLVLPGLPPGGMRRIPLPIRWSVAGKLIGLGIAAYPGDRPDDLEVTPPRVWTINARGAK